MSDAEPRDKFQTVILELIAQRGPGKSICPTEAAQAIDTENWRSRLRDIRTAAIHLANAGEAAILRKGKPVDPNDFKGVYRISLPPQD